MTGTERAMTGTLRAMTGTVVKIARQQSRIRPFCRTWRPFRDVGTTANSAVTAQASGILSVHSLTSALYLNPAARRIRCFLD
jgi:hypothetical protein